MTRYNLFLDPEQLKRLKEIATSRGSTVSYLIRKAIQHFLDHEAL